MIPTLIIAAIVAAPALVLAATFLPWGREVRGGFDHTHGSFDNVA